MHIFHQSQACSFTLHFRPITDQDELHCCTVHPRPQKRATKECLHTVGGEEEEVALSMAAGWEAKLQLVQRHVRAFPDFPKKGILFR